MPAKSNFGFKDCLECGEPAVHRSKRDIERKKFCSRACHGRYTGKNKLTREHLVRMQKLACTPEANIKKAHKGKEHHNYKKDRSQIKSKRPRYENTKWTNAVFERDDYTCQHCGIRGGRLEADHIKPYCLCSDNEKWDLENGRTLCVDCHKKTDTYGAKMMWKLKREASLASG